MRGETRTFVQTDKVERLCTSIRPVPPDLPVFEYDASPRAERCDRCGAGADGDLRFMILRGRDRYIGRTVCDHCAESLYEVMLDNTTERT
jgi:hypothetical protein